MDADETDGVREVLDDFSEFVGELVATALYAIVAVRQWRVDALEGAPPLDPIENPDPMIHLGDGPPDQGSIPVIGRRRSELIEMLRVEGVVERRLAQQFVVTLYDAWDGMYQKRLADAAGISKDAVRSTLIGDMRLLRNDCVHNRGIATRRHAGKCKICTFIIGSPIIITFDQLAKFQHVDWRRMIDFENVG